MTLPINTVVQGDCLAVLKTFPSDSVDSIVTDPPAGIAFMGAEWDDPAKWDHVDGDSTRNQFVVWLTEVLKECLRVLKPGGHMLIWSIPRTSHWTATAVQNAGFEPRDSIHHLYDRNPIMREFLGTLTPEQLELLYRAAPTDGAVLHIFGQGFPKGTLNISKAIDKKAGATRRVIKEGQGHKEDRKANQFNSINPSNVGINSAAFQARIGEITEPATPEAKQWDGWGTVLKPAVEMWWLARKPITAKTIVDQVLTTGTGAMNIDGCRIKTSENLNGGAYTESGRAAPLPGDPREGASLGMYEAGSSAGTFQQPQGRWPANLVIAHSQGCRRVGTKTVEAPVINRFTDGMKPFGGGAGHPYESSGGGTEEQPVFECVLGCPVRVLDEQSGDRPSTLTGRADPMVSHENPGDNHGNSTFGGGNSKVYADEGGASRFFTNVEPDAPFVYTGKASQRDKNAGLDDLDKEEEALRNSHPTVKSQSLMTWLVRLVTPKGGIVLDPFAGSGSTLVAAATEGANFVGIEREAVYYKLAKKRSAVALERFQSEKAQRDAFDLMSELPQE